ncbi:MAG: hypothetical protein R2705_02310 [Ilumatobacteraceae bacterium]
MARLGDGGNDGGTFLGDFEASAGSREDERLVALVAGTRQVVLRGVEVRRSLDLQRSDVVRRSDGITLTNPVRTLSICPET